MEWTRDAISDDDARLAGGPARAPDVEADFTLVHGSPRDPIWEYVTSRRVARASLAAIDTPHGLHGHTHVPVAFSRPTAGCERGRPGDGDDASRLDERPDAAQPGQRRPAARRRPAGRAT